MIGLDSKLPHNIEAEQALIGAALINADAVDVVEGRVAPEDFFEPVHGHIWGTFLEARRMGRSIDMTLTIGALKSVASQELFDGMTVGQYVARLASESITVVGCRDYAAHIRELADFRRMAEVGDTLRATALSQSARSPAEAARASIEVLDGIVAYGLSELDDATLGMSYGEMVLLGARPSVGKTATGFSIACKAARNGHGVAFFALEMGAQSITQRALSDLTYENGPPITYRAIRAGQVDEKQAARLERAALDMIPWPLEIEQEMGLTVGQITSRTRKLKEKLEREGKARLDLVVIDHVHLVRASERYSGNRTAEVTEISGALKALAKELDVCVLVLCQLNRGNENREDKRPQLSDLRDSGALEQDADVVLFLHRESYYLERQKGKTAEDEAERQAALYANENLMEIAIAKQRQGPIKIVSVFCDVGCNAIRDLGR
ncbi:MAG: hypothetical protein B7Z41_06605 [Rhizobiales bacterium 12-66-7]|nr:MAG: hypothetical protein B7Z41_06605 [Rhizobiales bacterium 12-66-7]